MSTATVAPAPAQAAHVQSGAASPAPSVSVSRIPTRRELRMLVLQNSANLALGVQMKLLARSPRVPMEMDLDEFLESLSVLERAFQRVPQEMRVGIAALYHRQAPLECAPPAL